MTRYKAPTLVTRIFVLVVLWSKHTVKTYLECPEGWVLHQPTMVCLKAFFESTTDLKNWLDSNSFCKNVTTNSSLTTSNLAVVGDRKTHDFIYQNVVPENKKHAMMWVGLKFNITTNSFQTVSGNEMTFARWYDFFPTDEMTLQCVVMHRGFNLNSNCSTENGFLCEISESWCKENNGGCEQLCNNTKGGPLCYCFAGHQTKYNTTTNSTECIPYDLCQENNGGCQQVCHVSHNKSVCLCYPGYHVKQEDPTRCVLNNMCRKNNGGCQHLCIYRNMSRDCRCYDGYQTHQNDFRQCVVKEWCKNANGGCEQTCSNTPQGPVCSCSFGYLISKTDPSKCVAIDWCKDNNGGCHQICNNTIMGPQCLCHAGYQFDKNNATRCVDIDECRFNKSNGGCEHLCDNVVGSWNCSCFPGYLISNVTSCSLIEGPLPKKKSKIGLLLLASFCPILFISCTCIICMKESVCGKSRKRKIKLKNKSGTHKDDDSESDDEDDDESDESEDEDDDDEEDEDHKRHGKHASRKAPRVIKTVSSTVVGKPEELVAASDQSAVGNGVRSPEDFIVEPVSTPVDDGLADKSHSKSTILLQ